MADTTKGNSFAYFMIGALVVAVGVIGYFMFAAADEPDLSVSLGGETVEVDIKD